MKNTERICGIAVNSAGAVYVEFLIVFFPMMLLWLGLAQIGLMYGAHIVVHSAAARAARAAVVIIADDRKGYEDRYDDPPFQIGDGGDGLETYKNASEKSRVQAIRRAARIALAAISPDLGASELGSIAEVLAGYLWTDFAVVVTFPDGAGGYLTKFNRIGPLTAKVTFLYKCPVPVANLIMCRNYYGLGSYVSQTIRDLLKSTDELGEIDSYFEPGIDEQAQKELDTVGGGKLGLAGLGLQAVDGMFDADLSGWRFYALKAEKTLPMQGKYQ